MPLPTKESILDSWIMVEHLSEGDISPNNQSFYPFNDFEGKDFYSFFTERLTDQGETSTSGAPKKRSKAGAKGIMMYFDIFKFSEVLDILRKVYGLEKTDEEINSALSSKFSFVLYFDKNLEFLPDPTFFTVSAFIRYNKTIPIGDEFSKFEAEFKSQLACDFADAVNEDDGIDKEKFNSVLLKVINKFGISVKNCRLKTFSNLESESTNLHSFFISDLEAAKGIETDNLNAYLFGNLNQERINLDSQKNSPNFNPETFKKILEPHNYPLGRYPSNTEFALSLMQQVAVNLATGYDTGTIRSVNGPPGTGKSTLLYDIFAQLVVQQAIDIVGLKNKQIEKDSEEFNYSENELIGSLPDIISENNIVVASSNNGAVQNIVNELPLTSKVDKNLIEELKEADYFYELSNMPDEYDKRSTDEQDHLSVDEEEQKFDKFWGLFSLEGGKKANIEKIMNKLKGMCKALDRYSPNPKIYFEFTALYNNVDFLRQKAQEYSLRQRTSESDAKPLNMDMEYDKLQLSNPWFTEKYRIAQSKLFIAALKVRKQFLYDNYENLQSAVYIWENRFKFQDEEYRPKLNAAWNWINFAIPVISSTFASFSRMCSCLGKNSIGHLFVDEAGQAIPQAAVGAIFRSKHVMVVGDPSQIPPVVTLDSNIMRMLGNHFKVTDKYLSLTASTQTLVDAASRYGFYKKPNRASSWIGIPLWVHRRCQYPMFTIANELSYNGMMVQGKPGNGKTGWFDVKGNANDKYVKEQGDFLLKKIKSMAEKDPDILDKNKADTIYVISPFKNVAAKLASQLASIGFTRYENQKPSNVGTIHTFQGKEAPIVFMVLGADTRCKGSAAWAVKDPNMMNVAVTRAKKEFYVIGDLSLYSSIGSEVASITYKNIKEYGKEHPDLVDNDTASIMGAAYQQPRNTFNSDPRTFGNTASRTAPAASRSPASPRNPGADVSSAAQSAGGRITGKVVFVHNGKNNNSKFAYITGDDGEKYTVSERIYSNTENAETVIAVHQRVSFVVDKRTDKYIYVKDVKPL